MKIALIRKRFVFHGGAENFIASFVKVLKEKGHEIVLLSNKWQETPNISFLKIPILRISSFLSVLSFALLAFFKVKQNKFDIVHSFEKTLSQDIYRAGDGCHLEFLKKRWPHSSFLKKLSLIINPFHLTTLVIEKIIFAKTKMFIAISEMGKKEIIKNYRVKEEQIKVIYNGIDFEKFNSAKNNVYRKELREKYGIKERDFVALFIGSGFERKGLPFVLKSIANITDKENFKLLVIGKDRHLNKYLSLAKNLNIEKQVIFLGACQEIEKLYTAGDLLIMPAIYEPFGNVCLEALASGIPVLISEFCGAKEVIKDKVNGMVIRDLKNSKEFAGQIETIRQEPLLSNLKKHSRESIKEYTIDRTVKETIMLYEKLKEQKTN